MDAIYDPQCMLDILDVENEETWLRCSRSKKLRSLIGLIVVTVIVIIFLLYFGSTPVKVFGLLIASAVVTLAVLDHLYWAPARASAEYRATMAQLKKWTDSGLTMAQAREKLKQELLEKQKLDAQRKAAMGQTAGLFAIAKGLTHKK